MKGKRKTLYLLFMVGAFFLMSDGFVSAAKMDYTFPDYVSVNNKVWEAQWRTKTGTTYTNKKGAEKVTEDDLVNLTDSNIALNCVKFKEQVTARQERGRWVAKNASGKTVKNYCEDGYSVKFRQGLASGSMIQDPSTGKWKLQVCGYYSQNLTGKIDELADPANIKMTAQADGKYRVTFTAMDKYPGIFTIKNLKSYKYTDENGVQQVNFDHLGNASSYDNSVVHGNSLILPPGESFYVEFYVNGASAGCTEEFVAQIRSGTSKSISNPVLNYRDNSGNKICDQVYKKYGKIGEADGVATGMVPDCYRTTVNYDEKLATREELLQSIAQLDEMLKDKTGITKSNFNAQKCSYVAGGDGIKTTTGTAEGIAAGNTFTTSVTNKYLDFSLKYEYWRAECSEEMTVTYDDPKAINAGGGFSYTTMITITRTCKPVQIKTPRKKPKCEYSADCMGKGHNGGPGAGPSEEFDSCVNTCDGGKYTQKCINSCYDEVYKNTDVKTISYTDEKNLNLLSYENKNNTGITQVAGRTGSYRTNCGLIGTTSNTPRPVSSCYILGGNGGCTKRNPGDGCPTCYTEHGVAVWYCDGCNGSGSSATDGVQCYEVWASTSDCAIDPAKDYYEQVMKAKSEYEAMIARIQKYTKTDYEDEKIQTGVYDNDSNKQVEFGINQQPLTNVEITNSTSGDTVKMMSSTTQTDAGYVVTAEMLTYTWKQYTTTRTQTVHLTQSYVSNTSNQEIGTGTIYQKEKLDCEGKDKNQRLCQKYYDGGYKFYSSLFAPTINDWRDWPYYNSNNTDMSIKRFTDKGEKYENIDVDISSFGSWNQWSLNIDCVYGLYQNFCPDCGPYDPVNPPEIDPNCDPSKDICSGGIQYIYREIHLDDAFPNDRNPRWNWTGTLTNRSENGTKLATGAARASKVSYRGYNIDPLALTNHIEKSGYSIYDVGRDSSEVDYEFTLTGRNLKNIRQYNKQVEDFNGDGENNYLDYDTSCYTKNIEGKQIEVCTNNFLDNEQYITYSTSGFTQNERKAIAGCNNAKSGQCYDVSASN